MGKYKEATGYIIHTRNFSDSSLILEFFSQEQGLIHLLAKGIKKNKRLKTQVHFFSLSHIQYFGKSQLKTLTSVNVIEFVDFPNIIHKTSALYLNELLHYSLNESVKESNLFYQYVCAIKGLGIKKLSLLLRQFEIEILKSNGFELSVDGMKDVNTWLTIDENDGLKIAVHDKHKMCLVSDLDKILTNQRIERRVMLRLNKLFHAAINLCFSNRQIYARELLKSLTLKKE